MSTNYIDLIPFNVVDLAASTRVSACTSRSVGKFIAPLVPVRQLSGRVKLFGTAGMVKRDNLSAPGDYIRSRELENGINPMTYDLLSGRRAEAAEIPVDYLKDCWSDGVCDMDNMSNLFDNALSDAVTSIMLSHSTSVVDLVTNSANYESGYHFATATAKGWTPWSQATSNPIVNIATEAVGSLKKYSPFKSNAAVIGQNVYATLQGNANLTNRFQNVKVSEVSDALMAALLGLTDVYVADDSALNPVTGEYEPLFPANGLLLFGRDQTHKNCEDYMDNIAGQTKFSSYYTYVPNCRGYDGGFDITNPEYLAENHTVRSNVLLYAQPLPVGARASGLQGTAMFIQNVLA
jgi:hypothetical protein